MSRSNSLMRMLTAAVAMLAVPAFAGERLDGIAATVNGHAIMQSEVQEELAYECLMGQQACGSAGAPQRQAALDHLINQQLIGQQMQEKHFPRQATSSLSLRDVRAQLISANPREIAWREVLERYGLTEDIIAQRLAFEADILRFTDSRFRPAVRISSEAIQRYYREQFVPRLKTAAPPDLPAVEAQIREVLIQQAITEQVNAWLEVLRQHSRIEVR